MSEPSFAMLRLWQLISPALPVGAYAYSQGMEYALHAGWIETADDVDDWLRGQLASSLAHLDLPLLKRLYLAWQQHDQTQVMHRSHELMVSRETRELQAEDRHLGQSLARLLKDLDVPEAAPLLEHPSCSFACCFALAAVKWQIKLHETAQGYTWAWLENQIAAAIKLVPLGQTAGQKMLFSLSQLIPAAVETGLTLAEDDIGMLAPAFSIASALHETQYSRLFRS